MARLPQGNLKMPFAVPGLWRGRIRPCRMGRIARRWHYRLSFDSLERRYLLSQIIVDHTADDGLPGSLRAAIVQANSTPGVPDEIDFQLPAGANTITLTKGD